jgi:hypothetical protein
MALELPPVKFAVDGIAPEGVSILAGKPKIGKGWLVLGLCVAIATGGVALGSVRVERGEALYMALEDNRRRLQKRHDKILAGGSAPEGLHIALDWPGLDEGGVEALDAWLSEHPDARLVVVDTLKKLRPRTSGNRSVYDVDYEALEPLLPLADEHNVAIVVVHHTRKLAAADPLDEISGSTGLSGGADGVLVLRRDRGRADAYLYVTGREIEEEQELALKWDANTAGWYIVGDADEYRMNEERATVIRALEEADEPMSPREVADAVGGNYNATRQRLHQMSKKGEVEVVDRGRYTLPNKPNNPNKGHSKGDPVVRGADATPNNEGADEGPKNADSGSVVRDVRGDEEAGAKGGQLREFLENPPRWFCAQATACLREGSPEHLVKPLAAAVAADCLGDPLKGPEARPIVEEKLEEMA